MKFLTIGGNYNFQKFFDEYGINREGKMNLKYRTRASSYYRERVNIYPNLRDFYFFLYFFCSILVELFSLWGEFIKTT